MKRNGKHRVSLIIWKFIATHDAQNKLEMMFITFLCEHYTMNFSVKYMFYYKHRNKILFNETV